MKVLVIIDGGSGGHFVSANRNTVKAAQEFSGLERIDACVLGCAEEIQKVGAVVATMAGVHKVWLLENESLQHGFAEMEAPILADFIAQRDSYDRILTSATSYGKNLLPRLGAVLDVQPLSDVIGIGEDGVYRRPIYAGNAILQVKSLDSVHLLSIRATAFEEVTETSSPCEVERVAVTVADMQGKVGFEGVDFSQHDRPELTTAGVVISGGRGMASGDNFVLLEKIAEKLNAAVGASRAAVDAGFVSNDLQVGQTGKVVAPDLYIAVGISGAIQHLAGMKDSKVIVAINNDEDAPIFQVADYGLVSDLFSALPELESRLS